MRIDYQQGDHLRVGRLLIARARQPEGAPIVDGGGTTLTRHDEGTLLDVLGNARHAVETRSEDAVQDLARSVHIAEEAAAVEHFGALVFRRPDSDRRAGLPGAVAVGWLNARAPHPNRWRPRFLLAQARWVLAGRPANVYIADSGELRGKTHGGGEGRAVEFIERTTLEGDGSFTGHPGAPFGDGPVELWPNEGATR